MDTPLFRKYLQRFKVLDVEFWIEISDSDFEIVMWLNRIDIWITIIQSFLEFQPLKTELLLRQSSSSQAHLDWNVRKVCVYDLLGKNNWHRSGEPWIKTNLLKLTSSATDLVLSGFFIFINFFYNACSS